MKKCPGIAPGPTYTEGDVLPWQPRKGPASMPENALDGKTPTDLTATLTERGARYGLFTGHAHVTQDLKRCIRLHLTARNKRLSDDQQEALDMIFHKVGRIVNGDADYADSWVDIAGYAKLVADRLGGVPR